MNDPFNMPVYSLTQRQKEAWLWPQLKNLSAYHQQNCKHYQKICDTLRIFPGEGLMQQIPVHINLFKTTELLSVTRNDIFKTVHSSGTSGQASTVFLDCETAALQSRALVKIMQHWLGKNRLPLLIIDSEQTVRARDGFNARAAGIKGLSFLGYDVCYALDEDMQLNHRAIHDFARKYSDQPLLIFGFTFMVWRYLFCALKEQRLSFNFQHGYLLHSGGWKKLESEKVSPQTFRMLCQETLGAVSIHNFYGLAEQNGSVFVECEHHHLHCPVYSDIIVRCPQTLNVLPHGKKGVLQLCSILPRSYPGHLLLTEDEGVILGEDDCPCGRKGYYFHVLGRLAQTQARGCSDTFQEPVYG